MKKQVLSTFNFKLKLIKNIIIYLIITFLGLVLSFEFFNPIENNRDNSAVVYENNFIPELPKLIEIKYNNIKFLGENFSDTIKRKKNIFIGSSTTQSFYVPNDLKWTTWAMSNINFWYNNCGFDGLKMNKLIPQINNTAFIKPDYTIILFDPFSDDDLISTEGIFLRFRNMVKKIKFFKSVLIPFLMSKEDNQIGHRKITWKVEENLEYKTIDNIPKMDKIDSYLLDVIQTIESTESIPIFISAPTPYGNYVNKQGIDMSKINNSISTNNYYKGFSEKLEKYCDSQGIHFIDGYSLAKNADLFYDATHFNLKGSEKFGKLINNELQQILK
ncbi:hypothetical protein SAMN04488008_10518 [Maribacter orientalis]|uniref:GDSL-like Lipase/Acylhydrolase n=1 Tax=Maribacter orientalis TaxID=228957 RepID=A0A1H7SIC8_9FLAO|nr:hypothetical protein [Maribacter orientalis]SEL72188.1 hypothetical protein SAMN04488008_10518 [Maribacter orientalis]